MGRRMAVAQTVHSSICGEQLLVVTVLRQVLADLHSPRVDLRTLSAAT
jgi:hypothetical protein